MAWRDDHLFCIGVTGGPFLPVLVRDVIKKGFVMVEKGNGSPSAWRDCRSLDARRLMLLCDWVGFAGRRVIYLCGTESGEVISMRSYSRQGGMGDPDSHLAEPEA